MIRGFGNNDTLHIVDDCYSTMISGNDIIVTVGEGKITLVGAARLSTVNIIGNEFIRNEAGNAVINTGNGNEYIYNTGTRTTVISGDGSDTIINANAGEAHTLAGSYAYIDGGNGNDYIENNHPWCDWSTINGGAGDDTIYNNSWCSSIIGGIGNDLIVDADGELYTIEGGAGNDIINNYGWRAKIFGDTDNDYVYNDGQKATIYGGDGADTIINARSGDAYSLAGSYAYIDGGNGNDYIENQGWCDWSTINGGAGDDTINNANWNDLIDGGAGNDLINTGGRLHTIIGGTGNDTITNDKDDGDYVTFQYNAGDGYDVINNYNSTDTISIGGSAQYTRSTVGSDVVISLNGGAMTLVGAKDNTINIVGGTEIKNRRH